MDQTVNHQAPDTAAELTAAAAPTTAAMITATCPPWCTNGHENEAPDDLLHMGDLKAVPCAVIAIGDGHLCGRTNCSVPEFNEPSCYDGNFAQIVGDETGVTIEVGHGDLLLPAMTIEAAEQISAYLAELATEARKAVQA